MIRYLFFACPPPALPARSNLYPTHQLWPLQRCDELLSVGQPLAALSTISEVFSSKKFRSTPVSVLEPILIKFLSLCVDLRKGRTAREGLQMYKNVVQNTSVSSVELVISKFVEQARDKLNEAIAKVDELEGPAAKAEGHEVEVEDLEATETPESLLLSAVSEEKSRDRTYRTLVTPWLRFLWEAYRTALDVLRNNMRLEVLYQSISHDAFKFCIQHQRKTEFRRLCEMLRSHLSSSQKGTKHPTSINLNDPDTLQRYLDTRFQQLNTAVELELWQEAFRTAEDIHGLIGMTKRAPKASMMATFYDKMVKVFGVGHNFLFHAAAYGKLYSLHAARAAVNGAQAETAELEKLSSLVLLSALAVPLGASTLGEKRGEQSDSADSAGRVTKLAALIGLPGAPTRSGLITDSLNRHVLKRVSPELRALYNILEVDFHPLSITKKIEPILASLASQPETARYVEPLKEVVLARLFQQLGQVYASLKIERVVRLASFAADGEQTRKRVERYLTEACRRGDLDVTIDHASGSIKFDQDLFGTDDKVESLQPSASTLLRTHLARLANTLYATLDLVSPANSPMASAQASRALAFQALEAAGDNERNALMARSQIIKRRKELADEQTARVAHAEAHERTVRAQQKAEEDARRAQEETRNRQLELIKKERAAKEKKDAEEMAKKLADSGVKISEEQLKAMDSADLGKIAVQQIEKDKKELATKLTSVTKRIDHLERAFRKEEIPLLQEDYQRQQTRDREAHVSAQTIRAETLRKQHAEDVAIKASLARVMTDYREFRQRTEKDSRAAYERHAAQLAEQLEEAKEARRQEIRAKREQEAAEAAERAARQAEAEAKRAELAKIEEEKRAEEDQYRAEVEERQAALRAEADEKRNADLAARLAERKADQEKIRAQQQREEEALARRQNGITPPAPGGPAPIGSAAWKAQRDAAAPVAAPAAGAERPRFQLQPRSASAAAPPTSPVPAPAAAPIAAPAPTGERPQILGAGGAKPSWREREAAQRAAGGPPPASNTPPPAAAPSRIASEGTWSSRRQTEQSGERPAGAGGAYRPPGRRV